MIRSSSAQKMLSDAIVTIRNDRFVIPVKQEYRSHYGGIIHDQSSSGQTLFIEPQAIVQLNNQLQDIRVKEHVEIERILTELSAKTAEHEAELKIIVEVVAELDFIFAKARYGKLIKASMPTMNNEGRISLFKARHPLIPIKEVVSNDIMIGKEFTTIVITGPNTGGKTVTLKTVGLCTLMAQAGLQIPALDGSELAVFNAVYADIGDEQSIEQSLSTFSSHMTNIVEILKCVDFNSLVLFDELGAGTDPQEGAALAISILDEVHHRGARVIATTHYPELKAYGYNREGVMNASVEFNVETLSPTYKLLLGVPGRSNAFEISKRLGLNEKVIEAARSYVSSDTNKIDKMISSLEESKRKAESEHEEALVYMKQAEKLHQDMQQQMIEFYDHKDSLYEKAANKAEDIVEQAKVEAEKIIRDLRKMRIEKHADVKEHELIEAKKRLQEAAPKVEKRNKAQQRKERKHTLTPGDEVKVLTFDQKGILLEKNSSDEWQVQIGILKMKVKEKDLEYISTPKQVETKPMAIVRGRDSHVNLELDLRGERYEDALLRVEKYVDDALLAGYPRVSIIHGKGTGALRQGVQEYLRNHRSVKKIRFGDAGEGGTGVTVVEFK
jgi:DNA mismatch repair protein MutS2